MRSLTDMISESFIWSVGITRPGKGQERRAAWYISGTLAIILIAIVAIFLFVLSRF